MGLDVVLSQGRNKSFKCDFKLTISENIHGSLFSIKNTWLGSYHQFYRIKDYYRDAEYRKDELGVLKKELIDIRKQIPDKQVLELLDNLVKICDEALEKDLNLYFVSD